VSLHIPKTGGISLHHVLSNKFGSGFNTAYGKLAAESAKVKNAKHIPTCIHGHNIIGQYGELLSRTSSQHWITFLREPLSGAISFYHFTKKNLNKDPANLLFEDKGLEAWLLNTKPNKWPFPPGYPMNRYKRAIDQTKKAINDFDFVGITERFDESMLCMYRVFGWEPIHYVSRNQGEYVLPELDSSLIAKFKENNNEDYLLYDYAVTKLDGLVEGFGVGFQNELKTFQAN